MLDKREEIMKEIDDIESNHRKLMAEFYFLKEKLAPLLSVTVTISDEDKRRTHVFSNEEEQEEEPTTPSSGKEKDKKKEKKSKKDDKKTKSGATAPIPQPASPRASESSSEQRVFPLSDFPKYVDDFLKVRTHSDLLLWASITEIPLLVGHRRAKITAEH